MLCLIPLSYSYSSFYFNQGLPEACCNLGVCYATGRGVPQSPEQAVHWYHVAADKGLPRAQSNLAGCYASGKIYIYIYRERERVRVRVRIRVRELELELELES